MSNDGCDPTTCSIGWPSSLSNGECQSIFGQITEFAATAVRSWLSRVGVQTLFITPGSPWENGYIESFKL